MQYAFISQPMNGLTAEEIKKNRILVEDFLKSLGYGIVDTVFDFEDIEGIKNKPLYYLSKALEKMATEADLVVMLEGYQNARGCMLELQAAKAYGIPVEYFYIKDNVSYLRSE